MKISYWALIFNFALIISFNWNYLHAGEINDEAICSGTEQNNQNLPKISVEKRDAWFSGNPLDHTYVKFVEANGEWEGYGCFGRCEDGKFLKGTKSFTHSENKQIVRFMTSSPPCKWPDWAYLMVGVCHQLANRGLYYTGNTVKKANGYLLSSILYGTFGWESIEKRMFWMDRCLKASTNVATWKAAAPDARRQEKPSLRSEHLIYKDFYGEPQSLKNIADRQRTYEGYRDKLLEHYITERIGKAKVKKYQSKLKEGYVSFAKEKRSLDARLMKQGRISNQIINEYNELINRYLAKAAEYMPAGDYKKMFGLRKHHKVDMRMFLPVSLKKKIDK